MIHYQLPTRCVILAGSTTVYTKKIQKTMKIWKTAPLWRRILMVTCCEHTWGINLTWWISEPLRIRTHGKANSLPLLVIWGYLSWSSERGVWLTTKEGFLYDQGIVGLQARKSNVWPCRSSRTYGVLGSCATYRTSNMFFFLRSCNLKKHALDAGMLCYVLCHYAHHDVWQESSCILLQVGLPNILMANTIVGHVTTFPILFWIIIYILYLSPSNCGMVSSGSDVPLQSESSSKDHAATVGLQRAANTRLFSHSFCWVCCCLDFQKQSRPNENIQSVAKSHPIHSPLLRWFYKKQVVFFAGLLVPGSPKKNNSGLFEKFCTTAIKCRHAAVRRGNTGTSCKDSKYFTLNGQKVSGLDQLGECLLHTPYGFTQLTFHPAAINCY